MPAVEVRLEVRPKLVFRMIRFTQGNLLDADVEAVVNTVNTVGIMGKGIALMFKGRFPANFDAYAKACKAGDVPDGRDVRSPRIRTC